jgi:hypothetical protein
MRGEPGLWSRLSAPENGNPSHVDVNRNFLRIQRVRLGESLAGQELRMAMRQQRPLPPLGYFPRIMSGETLAQYNLGRRTSVSQERGVRNGNSSRPNDWIWQRFLKTQSLPPLRNFPRIMSWEHTPHQRTQNIWGQRWVSEWGTSWPKAENGYENIKVLTSTQEFPKNYELGTALHTHTAPVNSEHLGTKMGIRNGNLR